jgi:hypothetical protein
MTTQAADWGSPQLIFDDFRLPSQQADTVIIVTGDDGMHEYSCSPIIQAPPNAVNLMMLGAASIYG